MSDLSESQDEGRIRPPGPDPVPSLSQKIQYYSLRFLMASAAMLPKRVSRGIGKGLGGFAHAMMGKHRKICLRNMDVVFGSSKSEAEKRAMTKACFHHFGRALMETLRIPTITRENYHRYVIFENVEAFDRCLEKGQGVLLCTAHYGNWEIMNLALGYRGLPMSVMARPNDNLLVHNLLEDLRGQPGNQVIYKHKSVRKVLNALRENRVVGIVNDQNVHDRNRIMVPFFGRDAATTPMPAAAALKTGSPIITGYSVPLADGRYLLKYNDPIIPNPDAPKDEEIRRLTLLMNDALEQQIRDLPHCWFWVHKRFKTGVDGETDFYKTPRNPT